MPGPVRLLPFCLPEGERWPPRAAPPPDHAELAAHLARQLSGEPAAGPLPPPHAEVAGSAGPRSTHNRRASFEAPPCGAPQDEEDRRCESGSEVAGAAAHRTRRDRPASFEAALRSAPQDEEDRGCECAGLGQVAEPVVMGVAPFGRPEPSVRAATSKLVDMIGLHLICPETRCRRARRCADPDRSQLPLCFWLHRGTCRFVLECLAAQPERRDGEPGRARRDGRDASLLGGLRRAGWPIGRLARSRADGADEWSWERVPEARALVAAYRGESR